MLKGTAPRRSLAAGAAGLGGVAAVLLILEFSGMGANRNYRATGTNVAGQNYLDGDQPVYLDVIP